MTIEIERADLGDSFRVVRARADASSSPLGVVALCGGRDLYQERGFGIMPGLHVLKPGLGDKRETMKSR
jgi:hypothetical protein